MNEKEPKNEYIKVTALIRKDIVEELGMMALRHGVTRQEELSQDLSDRIYIEKLIAAGHRIISQGPDGKMSELIFSLHKNPRITADDKPDTSTV